MSAVTETSAGVVVYRQAEGRPREFLLLQSVRGTWEFPKGKLEAGETPLAAARRELAEESGLADVPLTAGFDRQIRYAFRGRGRHQGRLVEKTVHFVLGRTTAADDGVRLSREHRAFAFLPFEQAVARLSHAGTRAVLRDAVAFLDAAGAVDTPTTTASL